VSRRSDRRVSVGGGGGGGHGGGFGGSRFAFNGRHFHHRFGFIPGYGYGYYGYDDGDLCWAGLIADTPTYAPMFTDWG
jgi:hypothetical protein